MKYLAMLLGVLGALLGHAARSDEIRPGYLELRQTAPDTYDLLFKIPALGDDYRLAIYVNLPEGTNDVMPPRAVFNGDAYSERRSIRRTGGLAGQTIVIEGLSATSTDVLVRIESLSGATQTERLSPTKTKFVVQTASGAWEVAATYLRLGIEHILFGFDHLLFVLVLVILIGDWRRVALTVTAFTIAHSITLAAATLGLVTVPRPPVEAAIALSIVLVAVEVVNARRGKPSLAARCCGSSLSASVFCTASVLLAHWLKWDCRIMRSPSRFYSSIWVWKSDNWSSWLRFWRRPGYSAAPLRFASSLPWSSERSVGST